jgi:23S rRNA (cytidine1920-2'-O)/16S rRNA (cytidine1409-2'-O)-methyltransferase
LRLDKLLVERGLAPTRAQAQALIMAGRVLVDDQKQSKAGATVPLEAAVRLLGGELRYVSRGGIKLEHALRHWNIDVAGQTCLDIGASTGGFTDCLLQHGAAKVIAIDTGYGQIDARLRADPRVRLLERTNARYLEPAQLADRIHFVAMDVSFISATLVLPAVTRSVLAVHQAAAHEADASADAASFIIVVLVKPQFEAGRDAVGKGGIVRDAAAQQAAVEKVRLAMADLGYIHLDVTESPILGGEGNREFLLYAQHRGLQRP